VKAKTYVMGDGPDGPAWSITEADYQAIAKVMPYRWRGRGDGDVGERVVLWEVATKRVLGELRGQEVHDYLAELMKVDVTQNLRLKLPGGEAHVVIKAEELVAFQLDFVKAMVG
jgi:hypothetical protein